MVTVRVAGKDQDLGELPDGAESGPEGAPTNDPFRVDARNTQGFALA